MKPARHLRPTPIRLTHFYKGMADYLAETTDLTTSEVFRRALGIMLHHHPETDIDDFKEYMRERVLPEIGDTEILAQTEAAMALLTRPDRNFEQYKLPSLDSAKHFPLLEPGAMSFDSASEIGAGLQTEFSFVIDSNKAFEE
jgi:hypothetical protein